MDTDTYAFRCEIRAVESNRNAYVNPGGSVRVLSETQICKGVPGESEWCEIEKPHQWHNVAYTIKFWGIASGLIHFNCNCKSGQNRDHLPVPCKHAAAAARRLVREKLAVWRDGLWYVHPELQLPVPFNPPPNVSGLVD